MTMEHAETVPKRKRASRKGQPKRFTCDYEGCTKVYSRQEHLQRHQLNHKPRNVYRCQYRACNQSFVRYDLFTRHQARHKEPLRPVSQDAPVSIDESTTNDLLDTATVENPPPIANDWQLNPSNAYRNLSLEMGNRAQSDAQDWLHDAPSQNVTSLTPNSPQQGNDNFVNWLFDSPASQQQNFDLANFLPYSMDFDADYYSPLNEFWNRDSGSAIVELSMSNASAEPRPSISVEGLLSATTSTDPQFISSECRSAVFDRISSFATKRSSSKSDLQQRTVDFTSLVLESCLSTFWTYINVQLPVIHQPTFSCDECHILLFLAIIMLGAGQLVRLQPRGTHEDYRALADLLATNLRWEIFPEDDAQPPIKLWVAQSLLLLEFYEKMYSTRRLHERAYTHHASTLALLRRGSPMVGRDEDGTSNPPTRSSSPRPRTNNRLTNTPNPMRSWWQRWARNESWHRVVFLGFRMDTFDAVLFGHESFLLPYEIRLPLPCDDSLWNAKSPEEVRRLEETFSMHGIHQQPFLDSLKRCLHGHEVHSHQDARMILVSGLLNVGWHINRREKHLQSLDTIPSAQEQERWRNTLLDAFLYWSQSFQTALEKSKARSRNLERNNDAAFDPKFILHMAYITTHVDILDAQIFAGSKRLLGRKITEKDYAACSTRMRFWAFSAGSARAVSHAFQLLNETIVESDRSDSNSASSQAKTCQYSCRADPSLYRPWVLYLAALTIWSYQYARKSRNASNPPQGSSGNARSMEKNIACQYIIQSAGSESHDLPAQVSAQGCATVLRVLAEDFAKAEWELLLEASKVLSSCADAIQNAR